MRQFACFTDHQGTVVHGPHGPEPDSQYEHSSVPGTISKLFNLAGGPLTKREAWAGTFESVLSRSTPRHGAACDVL